MTNFLENFHFQEAFVIMNLKTVHQQSHSTLHYTKKSYETP